MRKVRSWSNISRRKSSGNEEDTFFELCCAGVPTGLRQPKNAVHTPGSFSRPEFLNKGAEPQTVKQCAVHAAAASLVRESGALHGARANAGFDVLLEDSCLDGVSGNLQVGAGVAPSRCALVAETDRLHVMLESGGAGAVSSGDRPAVVAAGVSRHPHGACAGAPAWQVRSACVNVLLEPVCSGQVVLLQELLPAVWVACA